MTKTILSITVLLCVLFALAQTANASVVLPDSIKSSTIDVEESPSDFMNVFVVPEKELIIIQLKNLNTQDLDVALLDANDNELKRTKLYQASTIAFFETQTLYSGDYIIIVSDGISSIRKKISLNK